MFDIKYNEVALPYRKLRKLKNGKHTEKDCDFYNKKSFIKK